MDESVGIDHLHRGSKKNICQYCLPEHSDDFIHNMRVIQGHSGRNKVDLSLLDNVKIQYI